MSSRRFGNEDASDLTTWDGTPVAEEPPHGAVVVCLRDAGSTTEVLLLHRAHDPVGDGDWAWTPPSGARRPGEPIDACARRELLEETGIDMNPSPVDTNRDWAIFVAVVPETVDVTLDCEHDRYEWVGLDEATRRCRPPVVAQGVRLAAAAIRLD